MNHIRRTLILIVVVVFSITGVMAQELQEEKILLTFIPNIQFAPFYVAEAQGNFAGAGLTVTFEHLNEPDVLDLVAANQEHFGVVSGEQVILARENGRPVVYVFEWFQDNPVGIVYSSVDEAESIADLTGMKMGLPGRFGASYISFTALLDAAGLTEDDFQIEEIGYQAVEVVCVGGVQASVVYLNNEPLQIENRAKQGDCGEVEGVGVIRIADVIDLVSNGLITSETLLAEDPELVQAVVDAFANGLQATINNPARAYLDSLDYVENLPASEEFIAALEQYAEDQDTFLQTEPEQAAIAESREQMWTALNEQFTDDELIQLAVLLASIDLWESEQPGYSDLESWENMQATLTMMGMLDEEIPLSDAYTNDFIGTEE